MRNLFPHCPSFSFIFLDYLATLALGASVLRCFGASTSSATEDSATEGSATEGYKLSDTPAETQSPFSA